MVVVVGAALAFTSISLKDRQQANADADKMKQILASVNIEVTSGDIATEYNRLITNSFVVNSTGERVSDAPEAFSINIAAQIKEAADKRLLPVYECTLSDGSVKYILPMYGAGLWGPIWGYASVDSDGSTIYGAYFAHQGRECNQSRYARARRRRLCRRYFGRHNHQQGCRRHDRELPRAIRLIPDRTCR